MATLTGRRDDVGTPLSIERINQRRVTAVQAVVEQLKHSVLRGEVAPGTLLPAEADLCQMLGVSRATLREALQVLEQTGVVVRDTTPRRRLVAGGVDDRLTRLALRDLLQYRHMSFDEVMEVLDLVEPQIARLATTRATIEDRETIQAVVKCLRSATDIDDADEIHTQLHDLIATAAHNRLWLVIWRSIDVALEPMKHAAFQGRSTVQGIIRLHGPIADAIIGGDVDAAVDASVRHIDIFRRAYRRVADEGLDNLA